MKRLLIVAALVIFGLLACGGGDWEGVQLTEPEPENPPATVVFYVE